MWMFPFMIHEIKVIPHPVYESLCTIINLTEPWHWSAMPIKQVNFILKMHFSKATLTPVFDDTDIQTMTPTIQISYEHFEKD